MQKNSVLACFYIGRVVIDFQNKDAAFCKLIELSTRVDCAILLIPLVQNGQVSSL